MRAGLHPYGVLSGSTQGTGKRLYSDKCSSRSSSSSSSCMHVYLFSVNTPVLPLLYIGAWNEGGLQPNGLESEF